MGETRLQETREGVRRAFFHSPGSTRKRPDNWILVPLSTMQAQVATPGTRVGGYVRRTH